MAHDRQRHTTLLKVIHPPNESLHVRAIPRHRTTGRSRPTLAPMSRESEIRFLEFAGRRVAYAMTGDGPALVAPAWWISHLELDWRDQAFRQLWETIAQ